MIWMGLSASKTRSRACASVSTVAAGAFFAYARHPFDLPSPELARRLVREAGVLLLPGTMFRPARDPEGAHEVRIAFANIDVPAIGTLIERLRGLRP